MNTNTSTKSTKSTNNCEYMGTRGSKKGKQCDEACGENSLCATHQNKKTSESDVSDSESKGVSRKRQNKKSKVSDSEVKIEKLSKRRNKKSESEAESEAESEVKSESEQEVKSELSENESESESEHENTEETCAYIYKKSTKSGKTQCETKTKDGKKFCSKHTSKSVSKPKEAVSEDVSDHEHSDICSHIFKKPTKSGQTQCQTKPKNGNFCSKHTVKPKEAVSEDVSDHEHSDNICSHIFKKSTKSGKTRCQTKTKDGKKYCSKHTVQSDSSSNKKSKTKKFTENNIELIISTFKNALISKDINSQKIFDEDFVESVKQQLTDALNAHTNKSTMSGYQLFILETRNSQKFKDECADIQPKEVMQKLGTKWSELEEENKVFYKEIVPAYREFSAKIQTSPEFKKDIKDLQKKEDINRKIGEKWSDLSTKQKKSYLPSE